MYPICEVIWKDAWIDTDDITVADLTGTGVQDTAIARHAFAMSQEKKLGVQLNE